MTEKSGKGEYSDIVEEYIENMSKHSDYSRKEILKKITQKKEENKGITDIGALYMIKNELELDFSIKPREQMVDKKSDEVIKRQKTLDYLFSIKGTAFFSENFVSVKALFSDVLQKIDNDPFYYDEDYFCEYSDYIIQIMEGTKLTEFLPDFLRKLEDVGFSTASIIFENMIQMAKTNNVIGTFYTQFLYTLEIFLSAESEFKERFQKMDYYYDFIDALGPELVIDHFSDLLDTADHVPPGYNYENYFKAFEALFNEIKETKLIKENFRILLKDIDHKCDAFLALVGVIKEPELMKEKILDVFALLDELIEDKTGESDYYYAYSRLVDKIKEMQLINTYYDQLEKRL